MVAGGIRAATRSRLFRAIAATNAVSPNVATEAAPAGINPAAVIAKSV